MNAGIRRSVPPNRLDREVKFNHIHFYRNLSDIPGSARTRAWLSDQVSSIMARRDG
jgi:hypothetical protein